MKNNRFVLERVIDKGWTEGGEESGELGNSNP